VVVDEIDSIQFVNVRKLEHLANIPRIGNGDLRCAIFVTDNLETFIINFPYKRREFI
jgi:hypothetical protein